MDGSRKIGEKRLSTIGKGKQKIVLPMYPTQYHGEIQNEESEETLDAPYDSERETTNYIT